MLTHFSGIKNYVLDLNLGRISFRMCKNHEILMPKRGVVICAEYFLIVKFRKYLV